jgi:cell division protein FtsN
MTVPVSRSQAVAPPPVVADRPVAPIANQVEVEGTGGKYTVQVGAFDQLEKAESLRSQLAKNYDMVFVEKVGTSKTPYRVRVGRFPDMQSARKIEKRLANDGFETYVTTLN